VEQVETLFVPKKLAAVVEYQRGTIVSRTVLDKKSGSVTVFAFDKGQGLSEHTAPFDALVYILKGKVRITVSGKIFSLKAGEMLVMPANKPHGVEATSRMKMMLVMIKSASRVKKQD